MDTGFGGVFHSVKSIRFQQLLRRRFERVLYARVVDELLPNVDIVALLHLDVKFLDKGRVDGGRAKDEVVGSVYAGMVE